MQSIVANDRDREIAVLLENEVRASSVAASGLRVEPRDGVPNGSSNVTELFDVHWIEGQTSRSKAYAVRSSGTRGQLFYQRHLNFQWQMMAALAEHSDVPVPSLVYSNTGAEPAPGEYFVMEAVAGRVPRNGTPTTNGTPTYHQEGWVADLDRESRERLARNAIHALVKIHKLDWEQGFEFLREPERGDAGLGQYLSYQEDWYAWAAKGRSIPVIEEGLRWLRENEPGELRTCVTWGDARVGNMIFSDDLEVAAVIDWEMAAIGAPEMDVAWWFMFEELFTAGGPPLPGIPTRTEMVSIYNEISGTTLRDLHYFDVLAWVRISITCLRMIAPNAEDDSAGVYEPYLRRLAEILAEK
jgi:aminoglycoside phosphotransferase (APT) family kinase protein